MSTPMTTKNPIDWLKYKIRTCLTMHECKICGRTISCGESYYDGGYGRRAHTRCVMGEAK